MSQMPMRLFVAQVVCVIEEQWFAPGTDAPPIESERKYHIEQSLFAANDREHAYEMVSAWLAEGAFSDANHDGDGDLTRYFGLGIHELEELHWLGSLTSALNDVYGIELPSLHVSDIDDQGVPTIKSKEDLEVFRLIP